MSFVKIREGDMDGKETVASFELWHGTASNIKTPLRAYGVLFRSTVESSNPVDPMHT